MASKVEKMKRLMETVSGDTVRPEDAVYPSEKQRLKEGNEYRTIWNQLGGNRFKAMTGAKGMTPSNGGKTITFSIGRNSKRINVVEVEYQHGKDLYIVRFGRGSVQNPTWVKTVDDVYADQLQSIFTEYTGMYTRL